MTTIGGMLLLTCGGPGCSGQAPPTNLATLGYRPDNQARVMLTHAAHSVAPGVVQIDCPRCAMWPTPQATITVGRLTAVADAVATANITMAQIALRPDGSLVLDLPTRVN